MKSYISIQIVLDLNGCTTLHDVLRQFAQETGGWKWAQKQSKDYQLLHGGPAGYVISELKGVTRGAVAIAGDPKYSNRFSVTNIVPQDCFELTIDQYNAIGTAFARDFGSWCRKDGGKGKVRCSNPNKTLSDIIPAKKCRTFFERYLNSSIWDSSVRPVHPSDIEKLDVFICALFRYGAAVSTDEIERFLVVDRKWKPTDAAWVKTRIDTGLDVLRMDRKF